MLKLLPFVHGLEWDAVIGSQAESHGGGKIGIVVVLMIDGKLPRKQIPQATYTQVILKNFLQSFFPSGGGDVRVCMILCACVGLRRGIRRPRKFQLLYFLKLTPLLRSKNDCVSLGQCSQDYRVFKNSSA